MARDAEDDGWTVRFLHPDGSMLRITHPDCGVADVIAVEVDYQREALRRSRAQEVADGVSVRVLTVEDIIIHKLIANRFRDLADVQDILEEEHAIDQAYLGHWLDEWGVRDRYDAIANLVVEAKGEGD